MIERMVAIWRTLVVLSLVLTWVAGCGEPELVEQDEAATPAAGPGHAPTAAPRAANRDVYRHPSGAFALAADYPGAEESDDGTAFSDGTSLLLVYFAEAGDDLDDQTLEDYAEWALDSYVVEPGRADEVELWLDEAEAAADGFVVPFAYTADEPGEGCLYLTQAGDVIYSMILLAGDPAELEESWPAAVDSLKTSPGAASGPAEPAGEERGEESPVGDADSGFRPEVDGFAFENYGEEVASTDLTPAEIERMFGPRVCASRAKGECILTPPARQWMKRINQYMAGGHCEGMAVLSSLMYYGQVEPAAFGADLTHDLEFENEALQREIAYWWATQSTLPGSSVQIDGSPAEVLDTLIQAFQDGRNAEEWWAVGIYQADGSGGHAVTPVAVVEQGGGLYDILVYDNSHPDELRAIAVDREANTWQYEAAADPAEESELYEGDADTQTLELVAISPRLGAQDCDFCAEKGGTQGGGVAPDAGSRQAARDTQAEAAGTYEIWLDGAADLLIEDEQGRRIGYADGRWLNEIPGAEGNHFKFVEVWDVENEPVYRLPADKVYQVGIDGSRLAEADSSEVSLIGPGFFLVVDGIWLEPGEQDRIVFGVEESVFALNYWTEYSESPTVTVGVETEAADYAFSAQATEMTALEDTFYAGVDLAERVFFVETADNEEPITFDVWLLRIDDTGEHVFGGSDLVLEPDSTAFIYFLEWEEDGGLMHLGVDLDGDGEPDEIIELPDVADEFDWGE